MGKNNRFEPWMVAAIIGLGIAFSLFQYFSNRCLWLDEAYLGLNIMHKSYGELFKPLDYYQVAPIIFLFFEKFLTSLMDYTEMPLRLFPLLCFWVSILFFYRILKKLFVNPMVIFLALSLYVFNFSLIYFSSEVKQYMTDVCVTTVLYYIVISDYSRLKVKYYYLGIAGVIAIFMSNITPIILLSIGLYLLYETVLEINGDNQTSASDKTGNPTVPKQKRVVGNSTFLTKTTLFVPLAILSGLWLGSFALFYIMFVAGHPAKDFMTNYWIGAFMPMNPFSLDFWEFVIAKYYMVFFGLMPFGFIGLFILPPICLLGAYNLFHYGNFKVLILCFLPFLTHLSLSAFQLYPFETRLLLYTYPMLVVLSAYGIDFLFTRLKIKKLYQHIVTGSLIVALILNLSFGLPIKVSEIKQCVIFMEEKIEPTDRVMVSFMAQFPYKYYRDIGYCKELPNNIESQEQVILIEKQYIERISELTGKVWFLFTDHIEVDKINRKQLQKHCESNGYQLLQKHETHGASVLLYDFNKPLSHEQSSMSNDQ
jgi:hypothetical protein